jgi:hypothetical protein
MRYRKALCELETQADKKFGIASPDTSYWPRKLPLLLNIEADCSLPLGRTPRVVDVGMNDTIAAYLSRTIGSVIPALRIYASFLRSFGHLVFSVAETEYDRILSAACAESGVERAAQLDAEGWERVIASFKRLTPAPQDPYEQLQAAIEAVYGCWSGHYTEEVRAQAEAGISVRVQCAVHGSVGKQDSGSGLLQLRGMKEPVVHFLPGGEVSTVSALRQGRIVCAHSAFPPLAGGGPCRDESAGDAGVEWCSGRGSGGDGQDAAERCASRDSKAGELCIGEWCIVHNTDFSLSTVTDLQEALEFVVEAGVVYVTAAH